MEVSADHKRVEVVGERKVRNAEDAIRKFLDSDMNKQFQKAYTQKKKITRFINSAVYAESEIDEEDADFVNAAVNWNINDIPVCQKLETLSQTYMENMNNPTAANSQENLNNSEEFLKKTLGVTDFADDLRPKSVSEDRWSRLSSSSSNSMSTYITSSSDSSNKPNFATRKRNYEEWLQKKTEKISISKKIEQQKKLLEEEKRKKEEEEKEETRRASYQKWLIKKNEMKKAEKTKKLLSEQKAKNERLKKEKDNKDIEKNRRMWSAMKQEKLKKDKERQNKEHLRTEEMRSMRVKLGQKAFQKWLEESRRKPTPVPMNKGLLTMHGAQATFVNPIPWSTPASERPTLYFEKAQYWKDLLANKSN